MPFLDGAILTATDLNALDGRTVPTFTSTVTRDAGIPAPVSGRVCVVAGELQVYRSGSWSPIGPRVSRKTADESRANDATTAWNDGHLTVNLGPGLWRLEAVLFVSGDPAADVKIAWGIGVSGTEYDLASRSLLGPASTTTSADASTVQARQYTIANAVAYGLVTGQTSCIREDLLVNVLSSCNARLQWSQQAASATATVMRAGSRIYATRLS